MYDVIVCGGGPSGTAAAIAAGRLGAKVLLIERYGFCGGMATSALVNPWAGHEYRDPETLEYGSLTGGVFREIVCALAEHGGYGSRLTAAAFDDERLKHVYDELLRTANVEVRYHTLVTDVAVAGRRIVSVSTQDKSGSDTCEAGMFIDGTGDGDLAAWAGCDFTFGRPADGLTQPMTLSFRVGGVDKDAMISDLKARGLTGHKNARKLVDPFFQAAVRSGELVYPHRDWVHFYDFPAAGVLHFNMTRINRVSGLSPADLSQAELEGRRQAFLFSDWLRRSVPYFRNAYLEKVACQVGVRETRHLRGLYTIDQDDIVAARKFDDAIARSRYFIDIHSPTGSGHDHETNEKYGKVKRNYDIAPGEFYEVPYRAIVPASLDNLLVPCRALSATHEAAAAVRVMATMTATGEAAGLAAVKAADDGVCCGEVDTGWLRARIGYLDQPPELGQPWTGQYEWENGQSLGSGTYV